MPQRRVWKDSSPKSTWNVWGCSESAPEGICFFLITSCFLVLRTRICSIPAKSNNFKKWGIKAKLKIVGEPSNFSCWSVDGLQYVPSVFKFAPVQHFRWSLNKAFWVSHKKETKVSYFWNAKATLPLPHDASPFLTWKHKQVCLSHRMVVSF